MAKFRSGALPVTAVGHKNQRILRKKRKRENIILRECPQKQVGV
jgi:hypothetical protein